MTQFLTGMMVLCERCYAPLGDGHEHGLYLCPLQPRQAHYIKPDDIPGGVLIEHGICNEDGTPKRYDSQSAIDKACRERGMRRWQDIYEGEGRTKDARERGEWLKSGEAQRQMRDNQEREREGKRR